MNLSSVLNVIAYYSDGLGLTQADLYMLIFEEDGLDCELDVSQTAKNVFNKGMSGRTLSQSIMSDLLFEGGAARLGERIRTRWISRVGCHESIHNELYHQVAEDKFLTEELKQMLIGCCDPSDDGQLSYFIALCIICGNYNTFQQKTKVADSPKEYGINLTELTRVSDSYVTEQKIWQSSVKGVLAKQPSCTS